MKSVLLRSTLLTAALAFTCDAAAAQRTFVSTSGSDANTASNCSNTAPCRSFGSALTVTDSGGEIIVLSSGGYGPVTINKSVSIVAPEGVYAGISVISGNGIDIATAGVGVVLRGLTIRGLGGSNGVNMTAGASLTVQNCTLSGLSTGINIATGAKVKILDSLLHWNLTGAGISSGATAVVSHSRFLDNDYGLYVYSSGASTFTFAEVSHSEASGGTEGFSAEALSGGTARLNIQNSVANKNLYGVRLNSLASSVTEANIATSAFSGNSFNAVRVDASGGTTRATVSGSLISHTGLDGLAAVGSGAKLVVSGNTIAHNDVGLAQDSSAVLQSTGDNTLSDNTTANTSGTIGTLTKL